MTRQDSFADCLTVHLSADRVTYMNNTTTTPVTATYLTIKTAANATYEATVDAARNLYIAAEFSDEASITYFAALDAARNTRTAALTAALAA